MALYTVDRLRDVRRGIRSRGVVGALKAAARRGGRPIIARAARLRGAWADAAPSTSPAAHRYHQQGRLAADKRRWAAAAKTYQRAVDLDPSKAGWHHDLGRAQAKLKNWEGAVLAYQAAIARNPRSAAYHYRLGRALEAVSDWDRAASAYRRADRLAQESEQPVPRDVAARLTLPRRVELSVIEKPAYAYCLLRASKQAQQLGIRRISAVEFGVAGGNGLLALERHAERIEEAFGVSVDVYGFDTGAGLFEPEDIRDLPYFFAGGNYRMDVDALRRRLTRAHLVLGDAGETFGETLRSGMAPIGMMSFDMDFYSATTAVLRHLGDNVAEGTFLPRPKLYFDDVVGKSGQDYNEFTGELLAIAEFNESNASTKIARDRTFATYPRQLGWHQCIYTLHRFDHPAYATFIGSGTPTSLGLRDTR